MDVGDAFSQLKHDLAGFLRREVMTAYEVELITKGSSIDILVGHVRSTIDNAMSEDLDDIRVVK